MAVLCLLDDDGTMADRWEVSGRPLAIGRDESAEVVISDNTLSRRHFLIWMQGGKYILKDLNSQNGTAVDGKLVREAVLRHNDCIRAGRTLFLFNEHALPASIAGANHRPTHDTAFLPALEAAKRSGAGPSQNSGD